MMSACRASGLRRGVRLWKRLGWLATHGLGIRQPAHLRRQLKSQGSGAFQPRGRLVDRHIRAQAHVGQPCRPRARWWAGRDPDVTTVRDQKRHAVASGRGLGQSGWRTSGAVGWWGGGVHGRLRAIHGDDGRATVGREGVQGKNGPTQASGRLVGGLGARQFWSPRLHVFLRLTYQCRVMLSPDHTRGRI